MTDPTQHVDYPKMYEDIVQFFEYGHLPAHLQGVSSMFHHMAHTIVRELPAVPERTVALRKLLEAKDAAVRSAVWKPAS